MASHAVLWLISGLISSLAVREAAGSTVDTGIYYRVVHANTVVTDASRVLATERVATRIGCLIKCRESQLPSCWGVEYDDQAGTCKLVGGSGPQDWVTLSTASTASKTSIMWVHRRDPEFCGQPPVYGERKEVIWDGIPKPPGSREAMVKCKKGYAYLTGSLRSQGYGTTYWQKFGAINLTCGSDGIWRPIPRDLPICGGQQTILDRHILPSFHCEKILMGASGA